MKPGARVGALLSMNAKQVELLGYGVYEGDFNPEGAEGPFAEGVLGMLLKNPRIRLDNGQIVWGCECWWGPEVQIKAKVEAEKAAGATVVEVDIEAARKAYREGA